VAGFAVHRRVPARGTGCRVTRRIVFADVRLHFDDGAAGSNAAPVVNEYLAQQIARDVESGTLVEPSGQDHRNSFTKDTNRSSQLVGFRFDRPRSRATARS